VSERGRDDEEQLPKRKRIVNLYDRGFLASLESSWPDSYTSDVRTIAAIAGAALLLIGSACGYRAPEPPKQADEAPFDAPDPRVVAARRLSDAEVFALEDKVAKDPKDVESRATLLVYYGTGNHSLGTRRVMLWMIASHPEGISFHDLKQFTPVIDAGLDPEGYQQGKQLWLPRLMLRHRSVVELNNAAKYFKLADATISQKLLLRASVEDNDEAKLGDAYYRLLAGDPAWKYEKPMNSAR
jgi:hypothetical protein